MYFIVAIIMALQLVVLGAPIGHGHRDGHAHAELHRRVIDIVEVTETVFTTVTVTVAPSMTAMPSQEGTSTTLSILASSTAAATQTPSDSNPAPFRPLVPEENSAIILNSCAVDIYVSSVGDASCGPGTNLQLMRPYTTYREVIRVCTKGGIALKVSRTKEMTRPMQFEYAVWEDKRTVSYDISYLDCMWDKNGNKDMKGCVGYKTGIQAASGAECPVYKCVGNVECATQAYVVAEFGNKPGAPVGACSVSKGIAFELCAGNRM